MRYTLLLLLALPLKADLVTIPPASTVYYIATNPDFAAWPPYPLGNGYYDGIIAITPLNQNGLFYELTDYSGHYMGMDGWYVQDMSGYWYMQVVATLPMTPGERFTLHMRNLDTETYWMDLNPAYFGNHPVDPAPVPEPSSIWLLLSSLPLLLAVRALQLRRACARLGRTRSAPRLPGCSLDR